MDGWVDGWTDDLMQQQQQQEEEEGEKEEEEEEEYIWLCLKVGYATFKRKMMRKQMMEWGIPSFLGNIRNGWM